MYRILNSIYFTIVVASSIILYWLFKFYIKCSSYLLSGTSGVPTSVIEDLIGLMKCGAILGILAIVSAGVSLGHIDYLKGRNRNKVTGETEIDKVKATEIE